MALQIKYELRQFHIDIQGAQAIISLNVLITTYDDNGNVVKQRSVDSPSFLFNQLPANIQADINALGVDVIAALKSYYSSQNVTVIAPQAQ